MYSLKKKKIIIIERRQCIPNMRFVREEAYSSAYRLIWRNKKKIKAGGESSWWQGDCKPNRTRTVTAILESAMNKEEGQEERLSEHQFS